MTEEISQLLPYDFHYLMGGGQAFQDFLPKGFFPDFLDEFLNNLSEAELAAVLAHEVAHVDARHVIDEIRKGDVIRTARDEAELSGAVLDRVAGMGSSLLFTGLSRRDELEADSLGVVYAAGAGYRADAFLDFLSRVKAAEGDPDTSGRLRELQATHPPSGDRIRALERIVSDLPAGSREGVDLQERYRDSVLPHL